MASAASDSVDMAYLKQDKIGRVIAQGLSQVFQQRPDKPVTFLAHWLLNHSENNKKAAEIEKKQVIKEAHAKQFHVAEKKKVDEHEKVQSVKQQEEDFLKSFERKIQGHEYHQELLLEEFPEFLEKAAKLTGVYIGELNHPKKEVTEDDTDTNAHLQVDQPKLINYIGSSASHRQLMIGKTLPLEKGVTAEAFALAVEQVEGEEKKKKFVYVPDVIKNERVHFFRIPRLGSYIAVPLVFKSYLYEGTFDKALEQRKKYLHQKEEFDKEKVAQLEEIEKELEDARVKLASHQERAQTDLATQTEQEIKEIEQRLAEKQNKQMEYAEPEMQTHKKEFVVCADTLGQDREMSEKEQQLLLDFVKKFKEESEATELRLLRKDVEHQITYEHGLEKPVEELLQDLEKELELNEQQTKQLAQTHKEQKLISYYTHISKLDKLKEQLQQPNIRDAVLRLKEFRVLKFPGLVQHILYFLGYGKKQIDIPNTTHLNWKHVKDIATKQLLKKLLAYDFRGAKPNPVNKYAKVAYLESVFEKFAEESVIHYNLGLGLVLRTVKLLLALRLQDVEIRRQHKQAERKARNEVLQINQKLQEDKLAALQTHKQTIPPEQLQSFNEVEWIKTYEQSNPAQQVPPEVVDDIDNDI